MFGQLLRFSIEFWRCIFAGCSQIHAKRTMRSWNLHFNQCIGNWVQEQPPPNHQRKHCILPCSSYLWSVAGVITAYVPSITNYTYKVVPQLLLVWWHPDKDGLWTSPPHGKFGGSSFVSKSPFPAKVHFPIFSLIFTPRINRAICGVTLQLYGQDGYSSTNYILCSPP